MSNIKDIDINIYQSSFFYLMRTNYIKIDY